MPQSILLNESLTIHSLPLKNCYTNCSSINIAIQGCTHGCLDQVYSQLYCYTLQTNITIDLLLCCGDFQSIRNESDLKTLACPKKYRHMGNFWKYYNGDKVAPILTIFVGGNHEASAYLQELYYGGWVAMNIYYLGSVGVVQYRGLRIVGISGIYKRRDYRKGHHEVFPYDENTIRSVYHIREVDVERLKCLAKSNLRIDILLSHEWPCGIELYGNTNGLIRKKRWFAEDIRNGTLGCPPYREILDLLKPKWWFSAHLHARFKACYRHINDIPYTLKDKTIIPHVSDIITDFLALDKCLPNRQHLQVFYVDSSSHKNENNILDYLQYDLEWLAILQKTHYWSSALPKFISCCHYSQIQISTYDIQKIKCHLSRRTQQKKIKEKDPTRILTNFCTTAVPHGIIDTNTNFGKRIGNPQTDELLCILEMEHVLTIPYWYRKYLIYHPDNNEVIVKENIYRYSKNTRLNMVDKKLVINNVNYEHKNVVVKEKGSNYKEIFGKRLVERHYNLLSNLVKVDNPKYFDENEIYIEERIGSTAKNKK